MSDMLDEITNRDNWDWKVYWQDEKTPSRKVYFWIGEIRPEYVIEQAAAELASLRAALDEAREIMNETMESFSGRLARTSWIRRHEAVASVKRWLAAHPKE